jgi:hypothetical protein
MGKAFDTRILIVGIVVVLGLLIRPSAIPEITGSIPFIGSNAAH